MTPYYQDDWLTVFHGDCREVMAGMEPESVHCVVTSPPYWGLRDYGSPGQLGLEPTPEEYVANLVAVFREVRRVLRKDGTVWLNLGDSYANMGFRGSIETNGGFTGARMRARAAGETPNDSAQDSRPREIPPGLKPKDLVGIPWRVAFALQADGWYLRSDIIWSKPNPMPESVTDRPTKSHEYIFLLSKSPRYYFDADAVREGLQTAPHAPGNGHPETWEERRGASAGKGMSGHLAEPDRVWGNVAGRNLRSVWTMATQPYPGAHFATFPESLPERCIKAGTSEKGVCGTCGAPRVRVVEREGVPRDVFPSSSARRPGDAVNDARTSNSGMSNGSPSVITTGWRPSCPHISPLPYRPATVLDPFAGSGTTGMVAQSLSRRAVLIDLSLDYLDQLMTRNADIPLGLGA